MYEGEEMLYREESQYVKVKASSGEAPPHCEEFVECLKNALKIMESKYASSSTEEK
jgi:hypothetical protein